MENDDLNLNLPPDIHSIIERVISSDSNDIRVLLEIADLNINTDIASLNLEAIDLSHKTFDSIDLSHANLSSSNLHGSSFVNANFSNSNLTKADLSDSNLSNAILTNACLTNANLANTDLSGANLIGTGIIKKQYKTVVVSDENTIWDVITGYVDNSVQLSTKLERKQIETTQLKMHSSAENKLVVGGDLSFAVSSSRYGNELVDDDNPMHHSYEAETENRNRATLPVKIFTLGHFSIVIDNENLDVLGKGQRKALELLKCLIAIGGRAVGEQRICEALWPDAENDIAHTTFSVTLHRLRKLVGVDAVVLHDGCLSINPAYCWLDVWSLERLINDIRLTLDNNSHNYDLIHNLIKEAIVLYRGPFLGQEDLQYWAVSCRENLHNKIINTLLRYGVHLENQAENDRAVEIYGLGLEIDDLSEACYVGLMQCYNNLGLKNEAIKVYERCTRVLSTQAGMEPSKLVKSTYNNILLQ